MMVRNCEKNPIVEVQTKEAGKNEKKRGKKVDTADLNDVVVAAAVVLVECGDGVDGDDVVRYGVGKDDVEMDGVDKVSLVVD